MTSAGGSTPTATACPTRVLTADGVDLLVQTDLDVDGLVDRVLRIGPDGAVRAELPSVEEGDPVVGSVRVGWTGLLGRPLRPRPVELSVRPDSLPS